MKKEHAATVILAILIGLIVKAALETALPIFKAQELSPLALLSWAQLAVFFLMTLRFYLGAVRYIDTEPKKPDFLPTAINFIFVFLLFCAFYVTALSVTDPAFFYKLIIALHGIDIAWFVCALVCLGRVSNKKLSVGDIPVSENRKIAKFFFGLSCLTVIYAFASYKLYFHAHFNDGNAIAAHWCFLGFLIVVSICDFWHLREYYFNFPEWRKTKEKKG